MISRIIAAIIVAAGLFALAGAIREAKQDACTVERVRPEVTT